MNIRFCLVLFSVVLTSPVFSLTPTPAGKQIAPIAITGVTAHTGNGDVIEDAVITFSNGKITFVGPFVDNTDLRGHKVRDMEGQHVYPGFILPNSDLGLVEVNSLPASIDHTEGGTINPSVRSLVAYNTDSEVIPTLRFNGILMAQIVSKGKLISGTSSVVQLDAWNWEDAAYLVDDGVHLYWPKMLLSKYNSANRTRKFEKNKNYKTLVDSLPSLFQNARVYDKSSGLNLKLAAIALIYSEEKPLYIHADGQREIIASIAFARKQNIKNIVLVGARDALLVKNLLLAENIPVILDRVHSLPRSDDDEVDFSYKLPARLKAAGIKVGLGSGSRMEPSGSRNLPFMAGTAAAYGMSKEEALTMITRTNAEILGIADRVGSLEVGKDATMFISEGDALDMRSNLPVGAYIQGREINLEGTQQLLFKRYRDKYAESDDSSS
jgi:imidazolonepropionase-like amidohydrolase